MGSSSIGVFVGAGVGDGVGEGDGVGDGEGDGVGLGDGEGDGDAAASVLAGDGVGDGDSSAAGACAQPVKIIMPKRRHDIAKRKCFIISSCRCNFITSIS